MDSAEPVIFTLANRSTSLEQPRSRYWWGIVRGASLYNPRRNPERALERRNHVLDIFHQTGLLDSAEATAAKARPLGVTRSPRSARSNYPAFIDLVRRQLRSDYRQEDLRNEGLRVFTTLAPSDQEAAEKAVTGGMQSLQDAGLPATLQSALVLADVASGEVRALVGDRVPGRDGFNRAPERPPANWFGNQASGLSVGVGASRRLQPADTNTG